MPARPAVLPTFGSRGMLFSPAPAALMSISGRLGLPWSPAPMAPSVKELVMTDLVGRPPALVRLFGTAAAVTLLIAGCSSALPSATGGPLPSDDLAAQASAVRALSTQEQESQLAVLSADVEGKMLALSGLEAELGGPEQARTAYTAMTAALVARTTQFRAVPGYAGRFGAHVPAGDTPSLGGMVFAGWMISGMAAEAAVSTTNGAKPGEAPERESKNDDQGASTSSMTLEGSLESASIDWTMTTTENGVTGTLRVKITVNPCPDPTGKFTAKATVTASATSAAGRVGSNSVVDIELNGQIDDDAKVVSYDVTTTSQAAEFGSGDNIWAEVTDTLSYVGGDITAASRTYGRSAGKVPAGFADQWANLARLTSMMLTDRLLSAAQKGWESGRCVALDPTTDPSKRTGLAPSASVQILAAPRSKVDGSPTGGTVSATLAGDTSVDPAGSKVAADARFAYVAPGEKDKSASVSMEARSRRGVAKADVAFDTKETAYTASGGAGNITFSGTVPDLTQPFTIAGAGGAALTFSYSPTDATGRAGRMSYTGSVGGYQLTGSGSYTIAGDEGGILTLTQASDACAAGPLGCAGGAAVITLTPAG